MTTHDSAADMMYTSLESGTRKGHVNETMRRMRSIEFMDSSSERLLTEVLLSYADNDEEALQEDVQEGQSLSESKIWESNEGRNLGFWDVVLLHTAYSTAGGVIMMVSESYTQGLCLLFFLQATNCPGQPYIFGQWGYVLAPILIAAWMLLVYGIAAFVCDVMTSPQSKAKHHGDIGFELAGKWGRRIFNFFLLINMWFYLPVALDTIATALQVLGGSPFNDGKGCVGWWRLIVFGALLVILQFVTRWKETAKLTYISVFLLVVKACVLIPYGLFANQDAYKNSEMTEKNLGPAQTFLNPEPEWTSILLGLFTYTSFAIMIVADSFPHSKEPKTYKKAVGVAHIIMYVLYLIPGFCGVFLWGWNVAPWINTAFTGTQVLSIVLNLIIVVQVGIDFIISALVVNDSFRRTFMSSEPKGPEWFEHFKSTIVSSGER
ncbi:hypothetical protein ACHAWF_012667 [Thalassiosira exigua]